MYVADRDTFNDAFCGECGRITDGSELKKYQGLCEDCHEVAEIPEKKKIRIQTELTLQQSVLLYNALNPIGQRDFFGNLTNAEAKLLQTAIRDNHQDIDGSCVCFACIVFIE